MNRYLNELLDKLKGKKKRALLTPCCNINEKDKSLCKNLKSPTPAFLNAIFMPPRGFPYVSVENLSSGGEKKYKIKMLKYGGVRIDLYLDAEKSSKFDIEIFGNTINVESNGRRIALLFQGELSEVKAHKGYFSISLVKYPSNRFLQVWATGSSDFVEIPLQGTEVKFSVVDGLVGFIQFQAWGDRLNLFDEADPNNLLKKIPSSPFWVREWEERSRRLWHYLLEVRVQHDLEIICNKSLKHDNKVEDLLEIIISSLSAWPYWRPSASTSPKGGVWERGNWANGFVLGSYGLCLGLRYENSGCFASAEEVEASIKKGWSWLIPPEDGIYRQEHFPSVAHWLRRSTNHGIVILASALVGANETNRSQKNKKIDLNIMEQNFWLLVKASFEEGVYKEGIRYAQFSLQEALAYFLYEYTNKNFNSLKEKVSVFEEVALFFWLSGAPNQSSPYTTWGDCDVLPWKKSVVYFLQAFDALIPESSPLENLLITDSSKGKKIDREKLTSEPLEIPSKCLSIKDKAPGTHDDLIYRFYNSFGLTLVAFRTQKSSNYDTRLCVLGTKVHLTHNKDHDVGAFNFVYKEQEVFKEAKGRGLSHHSSLGLKGFALESPEDVYSCYGNSKKGKLEDRKQNPIFKNKILCGNILYSSIYLEKNFITVNEVSYIDGYHREFFFFPYEDFIIIVTRADKAENSSIPYLNFIIPEEIKVNLNTQEKHASAHLGKLKISIIDAEKRKGEFRLRKPVWCYGDQQLVYDLATKDKISSVAVIYPVDSNLKQNKAERYASNKATHSFSLDEMILNLSIPEDNREATTIYPC